MTTITRHFGLDLARFLAALIVAMGHLLFAQSLIREWSLQQYFLVPFQFGSLSVSFFFCLSGFVLSPQIPSIKFDPKTWTLARIVRLMPLYYFCWLVPMVFFVLLAQRNGGPILPDGLRSAILGLTASQSWTSAYLDMPNPPLWSLSVELWLSILLVLLAVLVGNRKHIIILSLLSLFISIFFPELLNPVTGSIYLFLLGIVLNNSLIHKLVKFLYFRIFLGIVALTTFFPLYLQVTGVTPHRFYILFVAVFTCSIVLFFSSLNLSSRLKAFSHFLGARTYSLYAIHYPILIFISLGAKDAMPKNPFIYILFTSFIIILATELTYRFIERPSLDLSRKIRLKFRS